MPRKRKETVKLKCEEALGKIEKILLEPEKIYSKKDFLEYNFDIGKPLLLLIKRQIIMMLKILDKEKYDPNYTYYLREYPDTEMVLYLLEVAHYYRKYT